MHRARNFLLVGLAILLPLCLISLMGSPAAPARAENESLSEGPSLLHRKVSLVVNFNYYEWWMARWNDGVITCNIWVEHPGVPYSSEVLDQCGGGLLTEWKNSSPCTASVRSEGRNGCPGQYVFLGKVIPAQRTVEVELPVPVIWVSFADCTPQPPQNRCDSVPSLLLQAEEPLPNELIIRIQGVINGEPFSCEGARCKLPMQPTGLQGEMVEFWADSSFGDSSDHFTALVRVVPWGDFMDPERKTADPQVWYVDVLSSQWRGGQQASCSDVWQVFPDLGGPPAWLQTPKKIDELASSRNYYILSGMLITTGVVDASDCPSGGMQSPRVANQCGFLAAQSSIREWQNQFDQEILRVSNETGVPAQLMKNVFSRESQFWPGIYTSYKEAGLGHLTENGADTVLLWNPDFFKKFCPFVLDQKTCDLGFGNLEEKEQKLLRGSLVSRVNAACPNCPVGIDLTQAKFSVQIFAESLQANCEQVGRMISNTTDKTPGQVSSYIDLWKFTLANYNAGSGCLSKAMLKADAAGNPLDWEHVSGYFEQGCWPAIQYVEDVIRVPYPTPTATPWLELGELIPTAARSPTPSGPTLTPTRTPTPTTTRPTATPGGPTSTPTATEPGYPVGTPTRTPTTSGYP